MRGNFSESRYLQTVIINDLKTAMTGGDLNLRGCRRKLVVDRKCQRFVDKVGCRALNAFSIRALEA